MSFFQTLVAVVTTIPAVLVGVSKGHASGYDYQDDRDLDTIDDLFDECPDVYAQTRNGCPGELPDNRTFTCSDPLQMRAGLSMRDGVVRIPLNRAFCPEDHGLVTAETSGGGIQIVSQGQWVPTPNMAWSATFTVDNHTVTVIADGVASNGHVSQRIRISSGRWVFWDPASKSILIGSGPLPNGASKPPASPMWGPVVSEEILRLAAEQFRHQFDITAAQYVVEGRRHGVRFTTTLDRLPVAVSAALFGPDSNLPLEDKDGDFSVGYQPPKAFAPVRIAIGEIEESDLYKAEHALKSIPQPGWLTVRFPHGICTLEEAGLGSAPPFAWGEIQQKVPVNKDSLLMKDSYLCSARIAVCTDTDQSLGNPTVAPEEDGTLTLWMDLPIAPMNSPCWKSRGSQQGR